MTATPTPLNRDLLTILSPAIDGILMTADDLQKSTSLFHTLDYLFDGMLSALPEIKFPLLLSGKNFEKNLFLFAHDLSAQQLLQDLNKYQLNGIINPHANVVMITKSTELPASATKNITLWCENNW